MNKGLLHCYAICLAVKKSVEAHLLTETATTHSSMHNMRLLLLFFLINKMYAVVWNAVCNLFKKYCSTVHD